MRRVSSNGGRRASLDTLFASTLILVGGLAFTWFTWLELTKPLADPSWHARHQPAQRPPLQLRGAVLSQTLGQSRAHLKRKMMEGDLPVAAAADGVPTKLQGAALSTFIKPASRSEEQQQQQQQQSHASPAQRLHVQQAPQQQDPPPASQQQSMLTSDSSGSGGLLPQQPPPPQASSSDDAQPRLPASNSSTGSSTTGFNPLPWRPLWHLASSHGERPPAFAVSAFLDPRPAGRPRIAVILAVNKADVHTTGWQCLLQAAQPADRDSLPIMAHSSLNTVSSSPKPVVSASSLGLQDQQQQQSQQPQHHHQQQQPLQQEKPAVAAPGQSWAAPAGGKPALLQANSSISLRRTSANNEQFFDFQTTTFFCELPSAFDGVLAAGGDDAAAAGLLRVTLVAADDPANDSTAAAAAPPPEGHAWLEVQRIPRLSAEQQAARRRNSSAGGIAICTPPLHTDAYAATLVQWTEFARSVVGPVDRVFVYAFNPGPFTMPLVRYYQQQGLFQVHEWIIPESIMRRSSGSACKLPFFYPSSARQAHGSANCTMHQDTYNIAWWGQVLAIQDCTYRAMAQGYRWVAVLDFDELLLPRTAPTWLALLDSLANATGRPLAASYKFSGVRLCPGCPAPLDPRDHDSKPSAAAAAAGRTVVPAAAEPATAAVAGSTAAPSSKDSGGSVGPGLCLPPAVGFAHLLWWTAVVSDGADHVKSISDPFAVLQAHVHQVQEMHPAAHNSSSSDASATGSVLVPAADAVKLHDRVHDIHVGTSFASLMLPLLRRHLPALLNGLQQPAQPPVPFVPLPVLAASSSSSSSRLRAEPNELCRLYGRQLSAAVNRTLADMQARGVFDAWLALGEATANVYGGNQFDRWAPLRR